MIDTTYAEIAFCSSADISPPQGGIPFAGNPSRMAGGDSLQVALTVYPVFVGEVRPDQALTGLAVTHGALLDEALFAGSHDVGVGQQCVDINLRHCFLCAFVRLRVPGFDGCHFLH